MRASGASTSATWRASSRVGTSTSERAQCDGALRAGQVGDHRQAEAERLARAGLAAAQHVPTREGVGDGGGLDRERLGDAAGLQRRDERLGQAEVAEAAGGRGERTARRSGRRRPTAPPSSSGRTPVLTTSTGHRCARGHCRDRAAAGRRSVDPGAVGPRHGRSTATVVPATVVSRAIGAIAVGALVATLSPRTIVALVPVAAGTVIPPVPAARRLPLGRSLRSYRSLLERSSRLVRGRSSRS